jgi:hydroxymethylpyrimidine pyrophosphatase-like HAD family hydrolase
LNNSNLKGFDEKWDTSRIDKYQMSGLLLSNNKFSNTLQKLLENEVNLNVFVNKDVGVVYKSENDAYEVISKKELMRQTIEKLYEHLNDFYNELVNGEYNDVAKDNDFFDKHIRNVRHNYNRYYYKTEDFKNKADEALLYFYNQVKEDAEKKFMMKMESQNKIKDSFVI